MGILDRQCGHFSAGFVYVPAHPHPHPHPTLQDLASGYMSGKLLLKLDSTGFLLTHHTAEHFPFLAAPANLCARTAFYHTLARLLFMEDTPQKFKAFVAPLQQVWEGEGGPGLYFFHSATQYFRPECEACMGGGGGVRVGGWVRLLLLEARPRGARRVSRRLQRAWFSIGGGMWDSMWGMLGGEGCWREGRRCHGVRDFVCGPGCTQRMVCRGARFGV